jgi:ABC-2 type transport system permease protein
MGIMSREYNSGSIKLLYSSPITNAQIIWGKFIALMVYAAALMGAVLFLIIFADITVKDLDLGALASGILGLYLLACAYCAIGLYMSTLTSYQVVAAVGTLAVLAVLNFIGGVGQEIEWVREITYWLCISGRANEMIGGLICSEDVIYFLAVIALFLSLSMMKLKYERGKNSYVKMILHYLCVAAIISGIAYISSRPSMMTYFDATQTKHKTLSKGSQIVMDSIGRDQKLTITTYVNLLEPNYHNASKKNQLNDMRRYEQYRRFNPNIEMKYVYYWSDCENMQWKTYHKDKTTEEIAKYVAKSWKLDFEDFLRPEELAEQIDLTQEEFRFVSVIEDEKGQKTFLRIFDDMSRMPSEKEISAALKRLIMRQWKLKCLLITKKVTKMVM